MAIAFTICSNCNVHAALTPKRGESAGADWAAAAPVLA
jgi:hypothetical protein